MDAMPIEHATDASLETKEVSVAAPRSFDAFEHLPTAFILTRGEAHVVVAANAAGRRLLDRAAKDSTGRPLADVAARGGARLLGAVLDEAAHFGEVLRDRRIERLIEDGASWCCTAWPRAEGDATTREVVVELRPDIETDSPLSLQRRVAERMLLSALRERDLAEDAEVRRERADFLAAASTRLGSSLDEEVTLHAVASSALPHPGGWCIVDLLNNAGTMQRLAIVHPDPAKQALACELEGRWLPGSDDPFGVPAMLRSARPTIIDHDVDQALAAVTPDRGVRRTLGELGIAALLTVPLLVGDRLRGAITFVSAQPDHVYTTRDVELAEALAQRSATAIEAARQHAEAVRQRAMAESESRAKSAYIGTISHELRTPLNAIGGYVDLIDLGVRGPVTELQHADLARIRLSQRHLLALITDVLNLVRVTEGATNYHVTEIVACDALTLVSEMLEPLLREKSIAFEGVSCDPALVVRADPEKLTQVLVNLVGNAIKFTPPGGRLAISADATPDFVNVRIADTGIGIPADALSRIFEPFAQVNGTLAGKDSGVGLGLSISRVLARGMGGDLTATSALGAGATFTLSLPRAR